MKYSCKIVTVLSSKGIEIEILNKLQHRAYYSNHKLYNNLMTKVEHTRYRLTNKIPVNLFLWNNRE